MNEVTCPSCGSTQVENLTGGSEETLEEGVDTYACAECGELFNY